MTPRVEVPREPTAEMVTAFIGMWVPGFANEDMARNCWKAFLDAATVSPYDRILNALREDDAIRDPGRIARLVVKALQS